MVENLLAQIGNDTLSQCRDEKKPSGARNSQHPHQTDHDGEIAIDQVRGILREAEIDHATDRDGNHQRRDRCDQKRAQTRDHTPAISREIGNQGQQWPQLAGTRRLRRTWRRGNVRLRRSVGRARGIALDDVHGSGLAASILGPEAQAGATMPRQAAGGNCANRPTARTGTGECPRATRSCGNRQRPVKRPVLQLV